MKRWTILHQKYIKESPNQKGHRSLRRYKGRSRGSEWFKLFLNCCRNDLGRHLLEFPGSSKISQRGWCKASEICSFNAWRARNPKSRFEMGMSQVKRNDNPCILKTSNCLLEVFGIPWFVAAQSQCLFCCHRRQDNSNIRWRFNNLQWHFTMN